MSDALFADKNSNGGDRIMVEDELRQDALSVFDEYDIDAEEV